LVRHPLYFGNFIIFLGFALFTEVWWFVLLGILSFWLYYERIIFAEEEFLRRSFGHLFLGWAEKTGIVFPSLRNWQSPRIPFSLRTVLGREYSGFFVIVATFSSLSVLKDIFAEGLFDVEAEWVVFSSSAQLCVRR